VKQIAGLVVSEIIDGYTGTGVEPGIRHTKHLNCKRFTGLSEGEMSDVITYRTVDEEPEEPERQPERPHVPLSARFPRRDTDYKKDVHVIQTRLFE